MKTIKTMFLTRTKWILLVFVITAVALVIRYNAFGQARHDTSRAGNSNGAGLLSDAQIPGRAAHPDENDPEHAKMLERLRSRTVPSSDFVKAVAAARVLPPSPLLQARNFRPLGPFTTQWTFPFLSPIYNDFGHGGDPCQIPLPPDSSCGASARIAAIGVDPTNADVVYVGSEGGLSKSTDGGQTWAYLSDSFLSQSIRCIAVDPVDPTIVYVGTGMTEFFGEGIYRSTDAGATWTQLGSTEFTAKRVLKIVIDPAAAGSTTSTTLYASVVKGAPNNDSNHCGDTPGNCTHAVWKSTNSGSTWAQIRSVAGPADVGGWTYYDLAIQTNARPSTLYVTSPDITSGTMPDANPPGVVYKLDGSTWTKIHSFPDAFVPSFLALAQSGGQPVLYLGYSDLGGHAVTERSTDQGSSWTVLNPPGPQPSPTPYIVHELFALGVDLADLPVEQHRILAGVGADLNYSTDGGATWLTAQPDPNPPPAPPCYGRCAVHVDTHSIAFCKSNPLRNYVGNDGGIYRADDSDGSHGFITWWSKNENLAGALMQGVSISADGSMVMGNQDNGTQLYAAPTPNPPWVFVPYGGGDGYKPKIDQTNSNKYYYQGYSYGGPVCGGWHAVSRVFNGNWADITPPEACARGERSAAYPALFVAPNDGQRVIVGFEYVYRSTDSGDSWTRIGPSPTPSPMPGGGVVHAVCEAPTNVNVVYAIMDRLRVLVTTDATNWNQVIHEGDPGYGFRNAITVDPADANTAYLACDTGIFKTTDTGMTWKLKTTGQLQNLIYEDVAIDPANDQHVFASAYGGVISSTNGGDSWSDMSAGIPPGMAAGTLSFNGTSRKLGVSTYGRGAYILDLSQ